MLARNRKPFQGNNKAIFIFFDFSAGVTPVGSNAKELITTDIPVQADVFYRILSATYRKLRYSCWL